MGIIEQILIAEKAGEELVSVKSARLEAGLGIIGDRYYKKAGTFSKALEKTGDFELTLIEDEEIECFNHMTGLGYQGRDFRRNIVTKNVKLNDLIGGEFVLGAVTLKAVRLCEPCKYLSERLGDTVMENMMGKCGIRAVILKGGSITTGDSVQ